MTKGEAERYAVSYNISADFIRKGEQSKKSFRKEKNVDSGNEADLAESLKYYTPDEDRKGMSSADAKANNVIILKISCK